MEHCYSCKHAKEDHGPTGCHCGCAVFQSPNDPLLFNSLKPGEEIMAEIEALRRKARIKDESSE